MIHSTEEKEFRIPKRNVSVVCHTVTSETISGDVFLDVIGACAPERMKEFFNNEITFFPIRLSPDEKPALVSKQIIVMVEVAFGPSVLAADTLISLSERKKAMLTLHTLGNVPCEILIDSPDDRRRALDVLNDQGRFLPVLLQGEVYSLINKSHLFKVLEI